MRPQPNEPADLEAVAEPTVPAPVRATSQLVEDEAKSLDRDAKREQLHKLVIENAQLEQDRKERQKYAHRVFCLICGWLMGVFILLLLQGWTLYGFKLADSIVITSVGSTTATVLGLFLIVANYLFPKRKE